MYWWKGPHFRVGAISVKPKSAGRLAEICKAVVLGANDRLVGERPPLADSSLLTGFQELLGPAPAVSARTTASTIPSHV
jgi:hypothetical protein